jgi:hypothetical protein
LKNNDYKIYLIENVNCNNKKELQLREKYYIENNECINKYIPCRTKIEYNETNKEKIKEYQDEYRINNKDKIIELNKKLYIKNKDEIQKKQQIYRENNKNSRISYDKNYYQQNKLGYKFNKKYDTMNLHKIEKILWSCLFSIKPTKFGDIDAESSTKEK